MEGAGICGRVAFVESTLGEGGGQRTYSSAMVAVCLVGSRPSLDGPGYRRAKGLGLSRWLKGGLDNDPSAWP